MEYASISDLEDIRGPLSTQERTWGEMLLTAANAWVADRCPGLDEDSDIARFVVLDVVKNAMSAGAQSGLSSFSKSIGPWSKSGTLVNPSGALVFTSWHRELLGLPAISGPAWHFGGC